MDQQRLVLEGMAGPRHDKQCWHLAEMLVRDADDGTVEHGPECIDDFLDLSWRDVLAAADDELLESAGNGQKTVLVRFRQITRVIPAIAEGIACLYRLIVITGHDIGTMHDQFALSPRRDIITVQIDNANCKSRYRNATGTHD